MEKEKRKRTSRPEWWLDKAATGPVEDLEAPFSETVATGIKSSRSRSLSLVLISVLIVVFGFSFLSPLWFWNYILGLSLFFTSSPLPGTINELFGTSNWFSFQFCRVDPDRRINRLRPVFLFSFFFLFSKGEDQFLFYHPYPIYELLSCE